MRPITEIIIHCTATKPDFMAKAKLAARVAEIKRWHIANGWADIGYHFLIDRDGSVAVGRPLEKVGAHVKNRNTGTIGISLFGGHGSASTDAFLDNFTPEQDASLRSLIADLHKRFGKVPVTGHNQYAAKACPGFDAPAWFRKAPPEPASTPQAPASQGALAAFLRALAGIFSKKGT